MVYKRNIRELEFLGIKTVIAEVKNSVERLEDTFSKR